MGPCSSKPLKTTQIPNNNQNLPPTNPSKDVECRTEGSQSSEKQKQDILGMNAEMTGSKIIRRSSNEGKVSDVQLNKRKTLQTQILNDGSIEEQSYEQAIGQFYHSNVAIEFMIPKAQAGPIFVPVVPYNEICKI